MGSIPRPAIGVLVRSPKPPHVGARTCRQPVEYLTPKIEDRALPLQLALAERSHHRGPSIPDLLIAATAELSS